ncbi:hypothetical protein [Kitasatospora mediocidica]|uniref:hypothetical protein n=1 Tax=Kitasatospora mediocidica TaxID=58352 RepID=UPI00056B7254|nr:hypothetical protein [Kitasatospora mediocidica]
MSTDTKPVAQYLTVGGATVELRSHRFSTNYTGRGRLGDSWHEVDGFTWKCLGCDTRGGTGFLSQEPYLPTERKLANNDANSHAETCRAMPLGGAK